MAFSFWVLCGCVQALTVGVECCRGRFSMFFYSLFFYIFFFLDEAQGFCLSRQSRRLFLLHDSSGLATGQKTLRCNPQKIKVVQKTYFMFLSTACIAYNRTRAVAPQRVAARPHAIAW
ncbi:hypothetical protein TW95_gp1760 [Pandoravirus inopinatum]|uniref:Uncharacterized protein n=1 Tax=Pandoravirus inopinatum TaxID=1605721 RepID=A0A0B5J4D0_9VIRU|nr:hypothetical protein TW95_gp1760 [Pandoravirus inopinatum]AJF98494.1 hypothetical protein [Pandoravirus inopinatum]